MVCSQLRAAFSCFAFSFRYRNGPGVGGYILGGQWRRIRWKPVYCRPRYGRPTPNNRRVGSTAASSPTAPGHLVTIDPSTALVTDIGAFGFVPGINYSTTLADIKFDPTSGILYGLHSGGFNTNSDRWLHTINLATGAATKVGTGSRPESGGEGLAANSAGVLYATPDGNSTTPTLRTLDKTTGNATVVAPLAGPVTPLVIGALAFDSSDALFGIQTDQGPSSQSGIAHTHLVKIDTSTGAVTNLGQTVDNADAIAIIPGGILPDNSLLYLYLLWFGS
jgi:hypothetical protein